MRLIKSFLAALLTFSIGMFALWLSGHNFERSNDLSAAFLFSVAIAACVGAAVYDMREVS